MTFNPDADISGNTTRKRGRTAAIAGVGGVGVLGILALIVGPMLGVDLSGLFPTGGDTGSSPQSAVLECDNGQDANTRDDCRMAGAQVVLDDYWAAHVDGYRAPQLTLVVQQTQTQCSGRAPVGLRFWRPPGRHRPDDRVRRAPDTTRSLVHRAVRRRRGPAHRCSPAAP